MSGPDAMDRLGETRVSPETIAWRPQPGPQKALIDCPFTEILWGGSRGGGKTDGVLGKYGLKEARYGRGFNGVFFRREMPQADDLIERAKEIYLPTGAEWREQPKTFLLPHGGRLRFRPLENAAMAQKYQGQNISDMTVEEAGNFSDPAPIDMLFGALRSKGGVPVQLILTANPGGVGHVWLKGRYIDPAPLGMVPLPRFGPDGAPLRHRAIYIPSRVQDNKLLLAADPGYVERLKLSGTAELVRAWLEGDWNVVAGAFFPEWGARHVVPTRAPPADWLRFRAMDWGSARPFAVSWWAVSDGSDPAFPKGALVAYREWYGAPPGKPNVGLRLTAEEVADGIKAREAGDTLAYGVADPAMFAQDGGPSIAERMMRRGVSSRPADNARVPRGGAMGGWDMLRARLKGEDGRPMLYAMECCRDLIRTLPGMQHDPARPEDLDTDGEDHACFAAGTMVLTPAGVVPIERMPRRGVVQTPVGPRPYHGARLTRRHTKVVKLTFDDGSHVVCTPDHEIMTSEGEWIRADDFLDKSGYAVMSLGQQTWSLSSAQPFKSFWVAVTTFAGFTSSGAVKACIGRFGRTRTARSLAATTSTTSTATVRTTGSKTSCASVKPTTWLTTGGCERVKPSFIWKLRRGPKPPSGTVPTRAGSGIVGTLRRVAARFSPSVWRSHAGGAPSRSWPSDRPSSVATPAARRSAVAASSIASSASVRSAAPLSGPAVSGPAGGAAASAEARFPRCSAVESLNPSDVFCLTVPDTGCFLLANGLVVGNCDAARYAVMSRPWTPAPKPVRPVREPGTIRPVDLRPVRRKEGRL